MKIFSKLLDFFVRPAAAESVSPQPKMLKKAEIQVEGMPYTGCRYQVHDGKGNLIEEIDTRILEEERKLKLNNLKTLTELNILTVAPLHKQLNAANGLLPRVEVEELTTAISEHKGHYDSCKVLINAAKDLDQLEKIDICK